MEQRWNLEDLHKNYDEVYANLDETLKEAQQFAIRYKTGLGMDLDQTIAAYEKICEKIERSAYYSMLDYSTHLKDEKIAQHYARIQERIAEINKELVFFTLAINRLPEPPQQSRYLNWINHIRLMKDYELSEELESFLCDKDLTAQNAWVRLFDEMESHMEFEFQGETVGISKVLEGMSSNDGAIRKQAAESLNTGLQKNVKWIAYILNTLMQDKFLTDKKRGFKTPMQPRHIANQIEPEVVEVLCDTVKKNYSSLAHRWYTMKAAYLGKDKIDYWDRNAPLFTENDVVISYTQAQQIVDSAYREFSPILADIAHKFFDHPWIDVPAKDDKRSGAFSAATVPSVHPYVLLNYQDRIRDVATLAHELGHAVHQYLARDVGVLAQDAPLIIAETASVFGEMLTFNYLKRSGHYDVRMLLASKIDDMINTVVRQIAFYEFEKKIHHHRIEKGELTIDDFSTYWVETQHDALGEAVPIDPICHNFWAYIGHFFHAPFYVYAYAFGDCLVNSLFQIYQETTDKKEFEKNYIELLKAGGSKPYRELLKPFNLDPSDPTFWEKGLSLIATLMDELEHHSPDKTPSHRLQRG